MAGSLRGRVRAAASNRMLGRAGSRPAFLVGFHHGAWVEGGVIHGRAKRLKQFPSRWMAGKQRSASP